MDRKRLVWTLWRVGSALPLAMALAQPACASVLGIGDRTIDPELDGGSDGAACADPCVLASGLNHPFLIASDAERVYWTEWGDDIGTSNGAVKSCPISGCGSGPLVYAQAQINPRGIAVDAQNVYWGTASYSGVSGGIWSCPIAGCASGAKMLASAGTPYGIALDATYVYWVDNGDYSVWRVAKTGAGGGPGSMLYNGGGSGTSATYAPVACAVDSAFVYLTDTATGVYRLPLGGGVPATIAPAGSTTGGWPLVLGTNEVYYGAPGQILRALKTWTDGGVPLVSTVIDPTGLSLDTASGDLYWSNWGSDSADDGTIGKVGVASGRATVLAPSLVTPEAVTVGGDYVLWLSNGTLDPDSGAALPGTGAVLRRAK